MESSAHKRKRTHFWVRSRSRTYLRHWRRHRPCTLILAQAFRNVNGFPDPVADAPLPDRLQGDASAAPALRLPCLEAWLGVKRKERMGEWGSLEDWLRNGFFEARRRIFSLHLMAEFEKILEAGKPYGILIRWKPLHTEPVGWMPDINEGTRWNHVHYSVTFKRQSRHHKEAIEHARKQ